MKKKKEIKKEDTKNLITGYIKLILLFLATIFLVILIRNWHLNRVNYKLNVPIIKETLTKEINSDEIYNYIRENENSVVYVGIVNDSKCRDFETIFNEVIEEKYLEDDITYLNITNVKSVKKFLKEFNKFYDSKLESLPSIIVFEDGNVKDILVAKKGYELDKNDIFKFLKENRIASGNY